MLAALNGGNILAAVVMLVIIGALVYTISALLAQHSFFRKWERRIGLLMHMEEKIRSEELEKDKDEKE